MTCFGNPDSVYNLIIKCFFATAVTAICMHILHQILEPLSILNLTPIPSWVDNCQLNLAMNYLVKPAATCTILTFLLLYFVLSP